MFDSEGNRIIDLELEDSRVFYFVDCMLNRSSNPGAGPINEGNAVKMRTKSSGPFLQDMERHTLKRHKLCYCLMA